MPIMFNAVLREAGLDAKDVRLLRHKGSKAMPGRTPYELWRDNRPEFERYQSTQTISNRHKLTAPFWAVFIVNLSQDVLFAGLYAVKYHGILDHDAPMPHTDGIDEAGSCDIFDLTLQDSLSDLIGKLCIDWGPAPLAWVQYADRMDKPILELRRAFQEPEFPGFLEFMLPLSRLENMPQSWVAALSSVLGVYLLTCPTTKEQYVGSATGEAGFWGRWQDYLQTGHGGNVRLRSRDPSDYQVSILEVAGTSTSTDGILAMEGRWQAKLQSTEMGLNRSLARR